MPASELPSVYQEFIALSRYARFDNTLGRRERWSETVERFVKFCEPRLLGSKAPKDIALKTLNEIRESLLKLDTMPSMRALMTAGPAAERSPVALYNCAYATISGTGPTVELWDDKLRELGHEEPIKIKLRNPIVFDEAFFILLNGTGFGFSVERQFITNLPTVGKPLSRSIYKKTAANFPKVPREDISTIDRKSNTIVVADSKEGWASALRIFIVEMYNGNFDVEVDSSSVRPAGTPLKIFGGRASGPQALMEMFEALRAVFRKADGRKLTSVECHDIMCHIARAVVVGGVRRAAMISFSNLSDERMRYAKSGEWWIENGQRRLANNSAAYTEKPEVGTFMREWQSLYESKAGERGIFNRQASIAHAAKYGRKLSEDHGYNPSLVAGTLVRTSKGIVPIESLDGDFFKVPNLFGIMTDATCRLSGKDKPIYDLTLANGVCYGATKEHKWPTISENGSIVKKETYEIVPGDRLSILRPESRGFGSIGTREEGFLLGYIMGDGWVGKRSDNGRRYVGIVLGENSFHLEDKLIGALRNVGCADAVFNDRAGRNGRLTTKEIHVSGNAVINWLDSVGFKGKSELPKILYSEASEEFRKGFVDGIVSTDGTVSSCDRLSISSSREGFINDLSAFMGFYGVIGRVTKVNQGANFPNGKDYGGKTYVRYDWRATPDSTRHFAKTFSISHRDKSASLLALRPSKGRREFIVVESVVETTKREDVWDLTVSSDDHCFQLSHCVTGNCHEIALFSNEFCNLTAAAVRPHDTLETLREKVRIATILGTAQATFTDFTYLSPTWKQNCDEERLLGVSLPGVMDHPVLQHISDESKRWLEVLSQDVVEVNKAWASLFDINPAAASRCQKPAGNSGELYNVSSGLHTRFGPYYIRRVRADSKDPLAQVMKAQGFPCEDDVMQPGSWVFSFPVKAPEGSVFRDDRTAIEQLEYWLMWREHWTDHNPSVTIYVKEHEWMQVGAWVWDHFDDVCGISFLPHSDHIYKQAPYEEITEEEYEAMAAIMPAGIDYDALKALETTDHTTGMQEPACSAGGCDLI